MITEASLLFRDSQSQSRTIFSEMDIVRDGIVIAADIDVSGGTVTTDRGSNERYSATVTIARAPWEDALPVEMDGTRARLRTGVESIGVRESVQVGEYVIFDFKNDFKGELSVSLKGKEILVIGDQFIRPRTPPYGVSTVDTIISLVTESVPDAEFVLLNSIDKKITSTAPWDKERWGAVTELADSIMAEVYCGHDGRWYITDMPDLDNLVPVAKVIAGPSGVVIAQSVSKSRDKVRNAWSVSGQSSDPAVPPAWAFAYDSNPDSPTYYGSIDPIPADVTAARLIRERIVNTGKINPDWTWTGMPSIVARNRAALYTAYRASGADGPTARNWLAAYIPAHGATTRVDKVMPPRAKAARMILKQMTDHKQLYSDWTWANAPKLVKDYNDDLLKDYGDPTDNIKAATAIWDRYRLNLPLAEDWTWKGAPLVVTDNNDKLLRAYKKFGGANVRNRDRSMRWLNDYVLKPAKAFLYRYVRDNSSVEVTVHVPVPQKTYAAQDIVNRLDSGLRISSDWAWAGNPDRVSTYRGALLTEYQAASNNAASAWLLTYLGVYGTPTFTGGRFGRVVGFYSSQFFTNNGQCLAYARRKLAESLAYTGQMTLSAGPMPLLEASDPVDVSDERGNPLPAQLLEQTTLSLGTSAWNATCLATGAVSESGG
jgi:hypothetical protein